MAKRHFSSDKFEKGGQIVAERGGNSEQWCDIGAFKVVIPQK